MSLLDFDDTYTPPFKAPEPKRYEKQTALTQEARDAALNNEGRSEVTEDYSDSPFADRI